MAEDKKEKKVSYSKTIPNPFHLEGIEIDKDFVLTDELKKNKMFMARFSRSLELKLIKKN